MKKVLLVIAGVVAGIVVTFVLVVGVEAYSSVVHPFPEGIELTHEEICKHVERYPTWILASVVPMWMAAAFAGTWMAGKIGGVFASGFVGILTTAMLFLNLWMAPYPIWFRIGMIIAGPLAVYLGLPKGRKNKTVEPVTI